MLGKTKKVHFIGIGGIGMSGIAEFLFNHGYEITGSDMQASEITKYLENKGIVIYENHQAENIKDVDVVVKSSAIKNDNPEVIYAKSQKVPVIRRAEMLAELMRMSFGIGIAGTHGKTTCTSLVGMVLSNALLDPTVIVGGKVQNFGTNNRLGSGKYIVVEADEYDRSFLTLTPIIAAITNIEADHLDCYSDLEEIKSAFIQFANKVPFFGCLIACLDDNGVQSILPEINKRVLTYGLSRQAEVRAINIIQDNFSTSFDILYKDYVLGNINTILIGNHNIQNILLAVAVGIEMDISFEMIKKGIEEFKGVYRRFEFIGEVQNIRVYDDYAHHPTEIKATLSGIRENTQKRIIVLFQPHLYSRTKDFALDFGRSFYQSDLLFVAPIYPAREQPIEGVSGLMIADAAIQSGHHHVHYIDKQEDIVKTVLDHLEDDDVLITMGAGDIHKYGKEILRKLS
ncbi:MAG: UDP-N-acetylmuramate--L-alanine ligase [Candidatus Cloacimonadales bacterium]|jgi:UDP-N-acetylmuramate--alanine ligase|nr:UDP-N-acetylmuramate--L-alanine ligase [Candidatus Cloacimonadota bacterium]MDD2649959.1 UDP-N-acetylmuramate--L-alanine ligase [Candidatus Cloacimonadota bacterium]MDD3500897.1 UDP-N-acetylmuramate--L-alanine ligase [Candidatus Cloacimonadota bacterium]MDX9976890.1 UDP-N-acetylmuramate--L-alanine ligase [Candidatus Cloacimonadales bacterium]